MSAARIALLGRLSIEREDGAAGARGLPGRRAELVFAYLAAEHQRTVTRDELADALWPGMLSDTWAAALRGVVTEVRRFLDSNGLDPADVLAASHGGYQLRLPPAVVVDLDEGRAALAAAREQLAGGIPAHAAAQATRAGALARLPFLPDHEGEWVDGVRDELKSIHTGALELQVRAHAQAGDMHAAADAAERLVRAEPFSEAAHQLRIRVLGEGGDQAGAVTAYEHCRAVLATELGVQPSAVTESVLREALERLPVAEPRDPDAGDLAAYSVLVVEDHDFQRRTAVLLLRGLGVGTIEEAADGQAALDTIARSGSPDVIVCDLEMPGMDGVEFIRHMAERDLASGVISSSAMEPKVVNAVEALVEAYGLQLLGAIEKPLTARQLAELLAAHRRDPAARTGDEQRAEVTPADIIGALDGGRIVARFRPMVDLATGTVSGAEATPGWHDPTKGWIAPKAFMGRLQAEGLVSRFTEHVFDLACAHACDFARAGLEVDVKVDVPGRSLGDGGLADRLAEIARERGADPRRIVCGIGQRALKRDAAGLAGLTRLRLKGFGVSVEDFGTPHTSGEQLARLPLTTLTLAATLVSGATADVRRIAALEQARDLGLVVAAAGCDSAADFDLLLQLGSRHAEGAFIADAMAGGELGGLGRRLEPTLERRRVRVNSPLSLRRLLAILLGVLGVLVAALFVVTTLQLRGANFQAEAENRRTESFLLADQMRQSSNDLTNMVRLYVSTGDARYRTYYDEILAIRAGTAPRPRGYGSSFWNRVLAEGKGFVEYGRPESLTDEMRAARFTAAEFDALNASLRASNDLAAIEREVMGRVEQRIRLGVDDRYFADVHRDYQRLVDDAYLAEKGVIMDAVDHFVALVDRRTLRDVERVRSDNRNLFVAQIAILGLIVLAGAAAMVVLTRVALRPLGRLIGATRRIAAGDYAERADIHAVSELEHVAGAFNEMADAVESDVAARERAEREAVDARLAAEHASRAKSTFLAAMSHEIRTPMIGVTGMLEVLGQTDLGPQQRHMVATAESSAQSLLQIIGDILDFSKIEAGRLEIAPTTFALRPLAGAAVDTFVHTASAKGLLLTWSADERLAAAHIGDPLRIRQIISNLLSNAVKFIEVGGIEVGVRALDESSETQTVEASVTDTGVGVPVEQQRRLFDEFSQAQASTAQRFGGTGLGLVICKRLALLMDGDVTMESTPGSGTTMRLIVPLPVSDPAAIDPATALMPGKLPTARRKPSRAEAEREGSLLLLAEDHPVNRTVLTHQLDIIGFCVDTAEDGQDAFEKYLSGRYGLAFTDINMPRMDGYELARAIRGHERQTAAQRTPIVALTANVMQGEPEKCAAAGMDDFAAKPTTIPVLAAKLHRWLPKLDWRVEPVRAGGENGAGLDGAVLDELTGGDAALTASVLSDFLATSREDLRALADAAATHDHEQLRRQAHRIAGAGRIVGAGDLALLAKQVESAAAQESGDWAGIRSLVDRLDAALATIAETIPA